jgi:Coenzyme PQQ synthesis protein D (PqqD)
VFKINEDVAFREVDGHLVVVNLQTGFYHSLNESATFIFQLIRQNKDTSEILREMCQKYELPEETARRDIEECIATLVKEQVLIEPRE